MSIASEAVEWLFLCGYLFIPNEKVNEIEI